MAEPSTCRCCGGTALLPVLDLGAMPLADRMLAAGAEDVDPVYPLAVVFCSDCSLVQLTCAVAADELFCEDYPYYSSFSPHLLAHAREHAESLMAKHSLDTGSFVVEVASNDGYLLKNFVEHGISVLGIDPAEGPVKAAREIGVPTVHDFFDEESADRIRMAHGRADVVIANNVLAHVPDQRAFMSAIGTLLKPDGVASIEVPYLRDLVEKCEFDTIYHEHFCYFSVTALKALMEASGLHLQDVARVSIHGGSLRLKVGHDDICSDFARQLLAEERETGMDRIGYFDDFAARVFQLREDLLKTVRDLRAQGCRIAAYGAAAKGSTMINFVGLGPDLIDYVVDRNHHKHGRRMPGQRLPILPPEHLMEDRPDLVLILAWNFADEIIVQQQAYRAGGGRFIVPVPHVQII
jgi:SAM-dependent methyltransferase